jgi:AAA family ATPase
MSSISSRRFTVESDGAVEYGPRVARRLVFNTDVLKSTKLCAGDIVAVTSDSTPIKVGIAHLYCECLPVSGLTGLFRRHCMALH